MGAPRLLSAMTVEDAGRSLADEDRREVELFMIDLDSTSIGYAVMSFGGYLELGDKCFSIPWTAVTLDTADAVYMMNVDETLGHSEPVKMDG